MSSRLKNAKINIYDAQQYCNQTGIQDWSNQICAGEYGGGVDSCDGKI
jgi:hypothetical protein